LGCPRRGSCASFGPYQEGNCAMNGTSQALLVASNSVSGALGFRWRNSTWPTTVNSCFAQQLVATTSTGGLLLLDPASPYPLLVSKDSGLDWSSYALPTNDGANFVNYPPLGSVLLMASDGALFTTVTSTSGLRQSLLRLDPGAAKWCQVQGVLGLSAKVGQIGAMRVDGANLVWTQNVYRASGAETSTMHDVALAKLRC
jgi:hypothetical protein